jgi:hypothetical protein
VDIDDELRKLFADDRLSVPVRPAADRVIVSGARRIRRRRAGAVFGGGMLSVATVLVAGTAFGVAGDAPPRTPLAAAESSGLTTTTESPSLSPSTIEQTTSVAPPPTTTQRRTTTPTPSSTTTTSATPTKAKPPTTPLAFGPTAVGSLRLGMTVDEAVAAGVIQPVTPPPTPVAGCQGYDWLGHTAAPSTSPLLFSPTLGLVRIGGRVDAETPEGIYAGSSDEDVRAVYPNQAKPHSGANEWVAPVPGNPSANYWLVLSKHIVTDVRLELAAQDCYQ